jgi:hypothetical protein
LNWNKIVPKQIKQAKLVMGFGEAVAKAHKLKRAFWTLEKLWIDFRENALPMIKDDREWKAAREQEIEEMKKEMEDKKLQVIRDKEESERQQMEMEEETMKEFIELEWEQSKKEGSSKAKAFTAITFLLTNDNDIL